MEHAPPQGTSKDFASTPWVGGHVESGGRDPREVVVEVDVEVEVDVGVDVEVVPRRKQEVVVEVDVDGEVEVLVLRRS